MTEVLGCHFHTSQVPQGPKGDGSEKGEEGGCGRESQNPQGAPQNMEYRCLALNKHMLLQGKYLCY